jgi:hypothetical protein
MFRPEGIGKRIIEPPVTVSAKAESSATVRIGTEVKEARVRLSRSGADHPFNFLARGRDWKVIRDRDDEDATDIGRSPGWFRWKSCQGNRAAISCMPARQTR